MYRACTIDNPYRPIERRAEVRTTANNHFAQFLSYPGQRPIRQSSCSPAQCEPLPFSVRFYSPDPIISLRTEMRAGIADVQNDDGFNTVTYKFYRED